MILIYVFIFIFGLCLGSFINALVYRLYEEIPLGGKARSICPKCKKQLRWQDNIPLLSFVFLLGKCHFCQEKISWQYPAVELITGGLFLLSLLLTMEQWNNGAMISLFHCFIVLYQWFIVSVLITIFLFDLKYSLIPDIISLPAIVVVFAAKILFLSPQFSIFNFQFLCFSAIIGGSWFALQYFLSKGRWVGGGDIRLGILMGLILPWPHVLPRSAWLILSARWWLGRF